MITFYIIMHLSFKVGIMIGLIHVRSEAYTTIKYHESEGGERYDWTWTLSFSFSFLFSHLDISSFIEAVKLIQKFKHSALDFSRATCNRKQKEVWDTLKEVGEWFEKFKV